MKFQTALRIIDPIKKLIQDQGGVLLFLGLVVFAGNFLYAGLFGVYDDDFIYISAFSWTWPEAWAQIKNDFLTWPQGRPVAFGLSHLLFFVTGKAPSLGFGYLVGFLFLLTNAFLLYRLAIKFLPVHGAIFAAAVFALYPADTSKAILVHRVFVQLNLTLLLSALLLYAQGKRWQANCIAPICFLIYEPFFLLFLLAPLLVPSVSKVSWRRFFGHGLLCLGVILFLLLARNFVGDPRLRETFQDPLELIWRVIQSIWIGPKISAAALVLRPLEAIWRTDPLIWIVVILSAGAFFSVAVPMESSEEGPSTANPTNFCWVAAVGCLALIIGYGLCFRDDYWPPIATIGRLSWPHAVGSLGASLLVGGLFSFLIEQKKTWRCPFIAAGGLFCGLLVSFGVEVQRIDYIKHADQQSRFWRTILETSAEWKPETVILVDISGDDPSRPFTPGMPLWWTVNFAPLILEQLVDWPADMEVMMPAGSPRALRYPRAYGFLDSMETVWDGDMLTIKTPAWLGSAWWPRIRDGQFLLFRFAGGRMVQVSKPVKLGGKYLTPMARVDPDGKTLPTSRVFRLLFEKDTNWRTIQKAKNYPR